MDAQFLHCLSRDLDIPPLGIFPWTYSSRTFSPEQFLHCVSHPPFHHHHPIIIIICRSTIPSYLLLTCTKLTEVDRLGSGVWVSASFLTAGENVQVGREIFWGGDCLGIGEKRGGNVLHLRAISTWLRNEMHLTAGLSIIVLCSCCRIQPKGKGKCIYIALFCSTSHSRRLGMDHTVIPANYSLPAFTS